MTSNKNDFELLTRIYMSITSHKILMDANNGKKNAREGRYFHVWEIGIRLNLIYNINDTWNKL